MIYTTLQQLKEKLANCYFILDMIENQTKIIHFH